MDNFSTKKDRERFISMTDVLNEVGNIDLLGNEDFTFMPMVSVYFGVKHKTIKRLIDNHENELINNGVLKLTREEFARYESKLLNNHGKPVDIISDVIIISKTGVLRIGMLLKDSRIAEELRIKLVNKLNIKGEKNMIYNGKWTDELDKFVFEDVRENLLNGVKNKDAFSATAEKLKTTSNIISHRWYVGSKFRKPLSKLLSGLEQEKIQKMIDERRAQNRKAAMDKKKVETVEDVQNEVKETKEDLVNIISETLGNKLNGFSDLFDLVLDMKEENKLLKRGMSNVRMLVDNMSQDYKDLNLSFAKLTKQLHDQAQLMTNTYSERILLLEEENDKLKRTVKQRNKELKKADKYIREIVTADVQISNSVPESKFLMERNGNLVKLNQ